MIPRKKDDQKERHGNRKIRDIKNEGGKKKDINRRKVEDTTERSILLSQKSPSYSEDPRHLNLEGFCQQFAPPTSGLASEQQRHLQGGVGQESKAQCFCG